MTWVDGLVLIVLGASALLAFMRGLVREALGILAWVVAGYVAMTTFQQLQPEIRKWVQNPDFADPIAFGIIFVVVLIAGSILARVLSRLVHRSALGGVDRTLGLVFGLLRGAVLVAIAYIAAGMLMPVDEWPEPVLHARSLPYAYDGAVLAVAQLPPEDRPRLYPPPGRRDLGTQTQLNPPPQGFAAFGPTAARPAAPAPQPGQQPGQQPGSPQQGSPQQGSH